MADQISLSEPIATLREVSVAVYDLAGRVVTGINESNVTIKISKAGASAFSSSTATLTEVTGGTEGGLYKLRFPVSEVDTLGDLNFEVASGSTSIGTILGYVTIYQPFDAADVGLLTGSTVADAVWDEVIDALAPANADTARKILNIIISAVVADCTNLNDDGVVNYRDTGNTKNRIVGTVASGIRSLTSLDGT